jgi:glycogen synthase
LVLVVLGTGERKYEDLFRALAAAYPAHVGVKIGYDNALAHKVEAGADMFLMPSRYEPSGLNQMYSLKYGTVPIVRATGGLDDSIEPFDLEHGTGTGFKFKEYTGEALLFAVRQALHHYMDERIWKRIQLNGMAKDFSWKTSAAEYAKLYQAARDLRDAGQAARGSAQSAEKAAQGAEQAPQGSGQAGRGAGQSPQAAGAAAQGAGQAARNQKIVETSN